MVFRMERFPRRADVHFIPATTQMEPEVWSHASNSVKEKCDRTYWSVFCVIVTVMLVGPVFSGRRFFPLPTTREVHDEDSFVIGFHLLLGYLGYWLGAQAVKRLCYYEQGRGNTSRAW